LIIIIVFVFIIKYLIDTINSLNGEIREIKEKCIIGSKASGAGGTRGASGAGATGITFTKNTEKPSDNVNNELIKTLVYFKDYFDNNK
jgi:hypothetical protein